MTSEELKRLKEICEKATPGPWGISPRYSLDDDTFEEVPIPREFREIGPLKYAGCGSHTIEAQEADAQFIAEARTAMPKLIKEVERLNAKCDTYLGDWVQSKHEFGTRVKELADENSRLREALRNVRSKIFEGIPYGNEKGPILNEALDLISEALGGEK